jgi:solute carrier family 25 (mitochondrial folate transporter), member 32
MATTLTYPIVVVRTVMFDFRGREKSHFTNIVTHIVKQSGVSGFYAGLKPDLIRLIPSNAIVFIVYE